MNPSKKKTDSINIHIRFRSWGGFCEGEGKYYYVSYNCDIIDILEKYSSYIVQTAGDGILALIDIEKLDENMFYKMISEILAQDWPVRAAAELAKKGLYMEGYLSPIELQEFTLCGRNINITARMEKKLKEFIKSWKLKHLKLQSIHSAFIFTERIITDGILKDKNSAPSGKPGNLKSSLKKIDGYNLDSNFKILKGIFEMEKEPLNCLIFYRY